MRLNKKYKKFSKLNIIHKDFPTRLLNFHRTKWKKIKQVLLNRPIKKNFFWSSKQLMYTKKWFRCKSKYLTGVRLKNYFDCLYDQAFSLIFYKNLKYLNKKVNKMLEYKIYLIKPEFRIDIFLWRLYFFSSCYHSKQGIITKKVKVNGQNVHQNYFLKKGDVINLELLSYYTENSFKYLLNKRLNTAHLCTFIEIDYYTNTIIILKNYNELTEDDIRLFIKNHTDVAKFKAFVE